MNEQIKLAAKLLKNAKHAVVFSGAGMSVESGIPSFRGEGGLWEKYDPKFIEITTFYSRTEESWEKIKEIFYDFWGQARPNAGHTGIAELEKRGIVKAVITQNIDHLHQDAGSREVYEYHGTLKQMVCIQCGNQEAAEKVNLDTLPPKCQSCSGVLKPDFIFFGEGIPIEAASKSQQAANLCDVMLVIGTTGEVMPAAMLPHDVHRKGGKIIEINPQPSNYTDSITDLFLQGRAAEVMPEILAKM